MDEPTKTEHLEQKLCDAIGQPNGWTQALVTSQLTITDDDGNPVPPAPAAASSANTITFPSPTADWGKPQWYAVFGPNPQWRWWAPWRSRTVCFHFGIPNPMEDRYE